ncbi:mechanosensitive ion channel family protein [Aquamicrobium sp. LC103]|uniref:mechanosensitive ion channel family protein n=1 Tax=Aquamicrobium sp. LC103 TaxID=1120658 RepID=UPI00063E7477|nr:mechanosensitive ion channel family protein [Aquamicrobium sp. LC103]TKT74252.1 mechanosensitive ion channel family protein [Aquamicrobium sp. LC103]
MEFLDTYPWVTTILAAVALILAALLSTFVVKALLLRGLSRLVVKTPFGRDPELSRHGVVEKLSNAVPAMVLSVGVTFVPGLPAVVTAVVRNVSNAFIILTLAMALAAVVNILDTIYHRRVEARQRPIKGYLQVLKLAIYLVAIVLMIATIMDRSPVILLSGLGAMAAVLILVFQDTLLSLVASIQISSTDMLRVGDWIEMPNLNADGDVIEIALHTVKVQNWDKTITTIPTRKLITDPFKNWRGMQESGGRRIKRSVFLDQNTIRFLTDEEAASLARIGHLETYMHDKTRDISDFNARLGERASVRANMRRPTNVGTFRAYVENYLRNHPRVRQDMTLLVRQLQPTAEGLPLEIYCFTKTIAWAEYEGIQSDIFDHIYAILPEFGLRAFQTPAGHDLNEAAAAFLTNRSEPAAA